MTKRQARNPAGPPQDCSFSALLQDIENIFQHRLAITLHKKCKFDGCEMRFDPTLVKEPTRSESGYTGWYLPPLAKEDDELPVHDCEVSDE